MLSPNSSSTSVATSWEKQVSLIESSSKFIFGLFDGRLSRTNLSNFLWTKAYFEIHDKRWAVV